MINNLTIIYIYTTDIQWYEQKNTHKLSEKVDLTDNGKKLSV